MTHNYSTVMPINISSKFTSSKLHSNPHSIPKLVRQSSLTTTTQKRNFSIANQRRQSMPRINDDILTQRILPSSFSIPLLDDVIHDFFQATQVMEEEIMLPSKLKDMPIEDLVLDNSIPPDNWHEVYTFIRDMRNQLQRTHPFIEDDNNTGTTTTANNNNSKREQRQHSIDEGIIVTNHDNNQFSSASSTVSSDEFDRSSISSVATSHETLKHELKHHYYGLIRSLDNLTSMANRVTEKYLEECVS